MSCLDSIRVLFGFQPRPRSAERIRHDNMVNFLRKVHRSEKGRVIYRDLLRLFEEHYAKSDFRPADIQYLCNILYDFPHLLLEFSQMLPADRTFALSDDFHLTRVVHILVDGRVTYRLASFGLIDVNAKTGHFPKADEHFCHLLRSCFADKEREEAMMTLSGGDAQCALAQMQQLMDSRDCWQSLVQCLPETEFTAFGAKFWKRTRRLLVKLAIWSKQLPPSLELEGLEGQPHFICSGGFSDIYRGVYKGTTVAVKRLRMFSSSPPSQIRTSQEVLYEEGLLWRQLHHPHILPFLGIDRETFRDTMSKHCIVIPWARHGNIRHCISQWEDPNGPIPYERWVLEIAEGLLFLHGEDVIHGDLRGSNILIGEDYNVLLTDFGLSDLISTRTESFGRTFPEDLVTRWTAPECNEFDYLSDSSSADDESIVSSILDRSISSAGRPSFATDIYSFACTCVEMYSNDIPHFRGISTSTGSGRAVERAVKNGERPLRPATLVSNSVWSVVEHCWSQDPKDRPSASNLAHSLRLVVADTV